MKLKALVIGAALAVSIPALALAQARAPAKPPADPNEPGRRLVTNGIGQIFVPFQSLSQPQRVAAPAPKAQKVRRAKKSKKS